MKEIKLLFAGDFCPRKAALEQLYPEKIKELSAQIAELTAGYDVSLVNVETVFTDELCPVKKSGPGLSSPVKSIELLKAFGFTIGAMANNHVCDQGDVLGLRSRDLIRSTGMLTMGYGSCLEDAQVPVRLSVKGKKISFLNYAENEFVAATADTAGFSPIHPYKCGSQIREEKASNDYVFVYLHAGNEQCPFPRQGVIEFCHYLIESGADGVIVAHTHCPQGTEYYQGKPIAYSMGNFYMCGWETEKTLWNTGYMVDITIDGEGKITLTPIPYEFGLKGEYLSILFGEKKEAYLQYLQELCDLITNTEEAEYQNLFYAWCLLYREECESFLKDFRKDLTADGEYNLFIRNILFCESHTEVWKNYYKLYTENRVEAFEAEKERIRKLQICPI